MAKILLVSRSPHNLAVALVRSGGHEPIEVLSFKSGLEAARDLPYDSIIVAEYKNHDGEAPEFMDRLWEAGIHHHVIVHSDRCNVNEWMKMHKQTLFATYLQTATLDQTLLEAIAQYLPGLHDRDILPGVLFQQKGEVADLLMLHIGKVGPLDVNVAVAGESGLGKERIAKAVHERSLRSRMPIKFVRHDKYVINASCQKECGECYLHRCFREAEGGTLALIDLPYFCKKGQAILSNKLHDPECNVRVVATADANIIKSKVDSGEFNANLWYELSEGMIELPPLRECPETIEWLAKTLLAQFCISNNRPQLVLTDDAVTVLKAFAWPGNVMQLNSVLIRKASLCESGYLEANDFIDLVVFDQIREDESDKERLSRILRFSPTIEIAAIRYGKSVRTIYNRMKKYNMDRKGEAKLVV